MVMYAVLRHEEQENEWPEIRNEWGAAANMVIMMVMATSAAQLIQLEK